MSSQSRSQSRSQSPSHSQMPEGDGPRERFERHAPWILETALRVGRRGGLADADARDFAGWAALRMVRRDYAVVRACRRPEQLRPYLGRVLRNLLKDYRNHLWGKWRPSRTAQQLGALGIELERMIRRDGVAASEAVEFLHRNRPTSPGRDDLDQMAATLPAQPTRTDWMPVEFDPDDPQRTDVEPNGGSLLDAFDRLALREARDRVRGALAAAMSEVGSEERELLRLLFEENRSVAAVARANNWDQRALYDRRDRCLETLRRSLQERGIDWSTVAVAL